jgi:hypothetical protein
VEFQFTQNEAKLARACADGGCGLTRNELRSVHTWQREYGYEFGYKPNYHPEGPNHYVCIWKVGSAEADHPSRVFVNGPRAGEVDNVANLKAKFVNDAHEVVSANAALFLKIAQNQH